MTFDQFVDEVEMAMHRINLEDYGDCMDQTMRRKVTDTKAIIDGVTVRGRMFNVTVEW